MEINHNGLKHFIGSKHIIKVYILMIIFNSFTHRIYKFRSQENIFLFFIFKYFSMELTQE